MTAARKSTKTLLYRSPHSRISHRRVMSEVCDERRVTYTKVSKRLLEPFPIDEDISPEFICADSAGPIAERPRALCDV